MHDYVGSKEDWLGAGLPFEGAGSRQPRLGTLAQPDVRTCGLRDSVRDVRSALGDGEVCVVVNEARVVLGLVEPESLEAADDRRVEEVMQPAPTTFRPHLPAEDVVGHLEQYARPWLLVTNLDGVLVGIVPADEVRRAADG